MGMIKGTDVFTHHYSGRGYFVAHLLPHSALFPQSTAQAVDNLGSVLQCIASLGPYTSRVPKLVDDLVQPKLDLIQLKGRELTSNDNPHVVFLCF
jgi:hypothetical protein